MLKIIVLISIAGGDDDGERKCVDEGREIN